MSALVEYVPDEVRSLKPTPPEVAITDAGGLTGVSVLRRLKIERATHRDGWLFLHTPMLALPLKIAEARVMRFGAERITAREYFNRVLEQGDLIDVATEPAVHGAYPLRSYWIHIEYAGTEVEIGSFSRKDDGDFAMRTKAGEKAERVAARHLRDEYGHVFADDRYYSPGVFQIRYRNKKKRKPDLRCLHCGFTVEAKKRNADRKYRISTSLSRPFGSENRVNDWHAFIFPDMSLHFVSNADIMAALANKQFTPGENQWDKWADIDPAAVRENAPPVCPGRALNNHNFNVAGS